MLRLKNIKIGDKIAEADYFPEDSDISGHIIVDLNSREIVQFDGVDGYGMSYPGHARARLVEIAKTKEHITECTVMWY